MTFSSAVLGTVLLVVHLAGGAVPAPVPLEFAEVAPQGFGDRQNSGVWSAMWWRDQLYVGTVRSWFCFSAVWFHRTFSSIIPYPPISSPDLDCASEVTDLPLQAEIWRLTPETNTWEPVYQSPQDVPIPGRPGKLTTREVGYRGMTVFKERSGTEALYVGGVTPNLIFPPMPAPRILRSTDGTTFHVVPNDPGTLLGDLGLGQVSFRGMETYKGRLYVVNGSIQGIGRLLEADFPELGNDSFRWVTPEGMPVEEVVSYNGFLYIGLGDAAKGYSVVKTDATGDPYTFSPVVPSGAYVPILPSQAVVSMQVFNNRLYVGTANPAELIRINPDDTWDLLVGPPRLTPKGLKSPTSGLGGGFNWGFNAHLWRMQEHGGALYIGTYDESRQFSQYWPVAVGSLTSWNWGFDLYRTTDGYHFSPITTTGFGDQFQSGIRTFNSTPYGLYFGTVDMYYGLRVWQGTPGRPDVEPPERLEGETHFGNVLLSWEPAAFAEPTRFHVFRSDFVAPPQPLLRGLLGIPAPFQKIGTTTDLFFVDATGHPFQQYQYHVVAEDSTGALSAPSNVVLSSFLSPKVTFSSVERSMVQWVGAGTPLVWPLRTARVFASARNYSASVGQLGVLWQRVEAELRKGSVRSWRADDLQVLLTMLLRRVRLAEAGLLSSGDLLR